MKTALLALAVVFLGLDAKADPYIQSILGGKFYVSQGATFAPTTLKYDQTFTNLALFYHPLSAGSIIPPKLQAWIPPESWACTVGASYLPRQGGGGGVGVGCGFNLLDSVRGWASNALMSINNDAIYAMGKQIAPGTGPVNLYVSRMETINIGGKFVPRWFFGASFGF